MFDIPPLLTYSVCRIISKIQNFIYSSFQQQQFHRALKRVGICLICVLNFKIGSHSLSLTAESPEGEKRA